MKVIQNNYDPSVLEFPKEVTCVRCGSVILLESESEMDKITANGLAGKVLKPGEELQFS